MGDGRDILMEEAARPDTRCLRGTPRLDQPQGEWGHISHAPSKGSSGIILGTGLQKLVEIHALGCSGRGGQVGRITYAG